MATKGFDFRSLNKFLSSQAADDFNRFLEKVPQNAGKTALLAGAVVWAAVATLGLFSMLQTKNLIELRGQLQASEAMKPTIPVITMAAVPPEQVKAFADKAKAMYPGLTVSPNANVLSIQAKDTSAYAQFREILGSAVSGGEGWKVSINSLCVGRECPQNAMDASLKIEKLNIDKPVPATPSETPATESAAPPQ